jgi:hypothetical protein
MKSSCTRVAKRQQVSDLTSCSILVTVWTTWQAWSNATKQSQMKLCFADVYGRKWN